MQVFSITKIEEVNKCIEWIMGHVRLGRSVVVHLDECDHGSGTRQILARVWREICDNVKITSILYSATPEEVIYSNEVDQDEQFTEMQDEIITTGAFIKYDPVYYNPTFSLTSGFCGPSAFLDANLVQEATPFFHKLQNNSFALTPQGRLICETLKRDIQTNPNRNLLIVRLPYSELRKGRENRKINKAIYQFLRNIQQFPELDDFHIIVDKSENFESLPDRILTERIKWANPEFWRGKTTGIPILLILDQTSTRSTEWKCHNRVHTVHTYRNTLQFGTDSQAGERVNHYANSYGSFQPIKVYGSVKTFQLSAGRITYENYMTKEWYARKVDRRRAGEVDLYEVKNTQTQELHPLCRNSAVTRQDADRILQECACFQNPTLSNRVKGKVKQVAKVKTTWHPCDIHSFAQVNNSPAFQEQRGDHIFANPFENAQMNGNQYMGYLRGWQVFEYSDIQTSRWGFNATTKSPRLVICYNNGVLGVALRTLEGFEQESTLTNYRSMYR